MKRVFDVTISGVALIVLSPLMVVIAGIVAGTSPGGVFFRGPRVGQHGKTFRIFKFRTMVKDAEGRGNWNVGLNDQRVTRVGKFLRASKLDELPQFLNVLHGDMSLVGPRPELQYYVDMYTQHETRILQMKPGITDWASLVNYSQYRAFTESDDPDKHYVSIIRPLKLHMQLYQLDHQSFPNDIRVLIWTVFNVFRRDRALPADVQRIVASFNRQETVEVGSTNEQS